MPLKTLTVNAPLIESDVLNYVCDPDYCKESDILAAGSGSDNKAQVGTVLGSVLRGAVAVGTVVPSGTGNGVLTKATPAYSADASAGNYRVEFIDATTDLGDFVVTRPNGTIDGYGRVGTPYTGEVNLTVADGSVDFITGDAFVLPVTVAAGSLKMVPLNLSGTDGSQNVARVSLMNAVAADGGSDQGILTLARGPAVVREQGLIWPAGATDNQKAAGIVQLNALGIVVRPG